MHEYKNYFDINLKETVLKQTHFGAPIGINGESSEGF
jgi:hypothetical protein